MHTDNPRGMLAMTLSMALFVTNDAAMKFVGESLPTAQTVFLRGVFVTALLIVAAGIQGKLWHFRTLAHRHVMTRAVLEVIGSYGYLAALMHIPLAIALGINMAVPLVVLPFAVLLLGEYVGWRRWTALAVGFAGVLLVVQPGPGGVNWWAVVALIATAAHALRDVMTRRIPVAIPSILVTAFSAAVLAAASGIVVVYEGWQPVTAQQLAVLVAASVMVGAGMHLLVIATRIGEASVVTGFRYTALLWGIFLGYMIWGDLPGLAAWAGIVLIVGAGLYAAHRERVRLRQAGLTP
jgi:drug/metabolite transporter (DMT)-like permease